MYLGLRLRHLHLRWILRHHRHGDREVAAEGRPSHCLIHHRKTIRDREFRLRLVLESLDSPDLRRVCGHDVNW